MTAQVVIHDAAERRWLQFRNPVQEIRADRVDDVVSCLWRLQTEVASRGLYAAGFISYEAAPACDPALSVRPDTSSFPLLWFGLFEDVEPLAGLPPVDDAQAPVGPWEPSVGRADYHKNIERVKEHLSAGDTYQVNYTVRLRSHFDGDAWQLFRILAGNQEASYGAYVEQGRFALCSASPELFFRLDHGTVTSKPMKGTVRRGRTLEEDRQHADWLQHSEKNRAENVMIVDMIRNDIGRVAQPGTVAVPRLFEVERYPTLWQMTSTVTAETQAALPDIMTALFPCASITGAPKPRTMQIIAELETTPRRIYTGTIGFIAPSGTAQFNVAIRTVLIDREERTAEYGTGGGIVWDSEPADEYDECQLKARILFEQRPSFCLLETMLWTAEDSTFLLAHHLRRLQDTAEYFAVPLCVESIQAVIERQTRSLPPTPHKLRLLVAKDGTPTVAAVPLDSAGTTTRVRLQLAGRPVDSSDPFLYHKTTHRAVYNDAKAAHPDCDDVLLWNEKGEVTEACIANVVAELDGQLVTPPVDCGLLAGTFRAWLLEQGQIRERILSIEELERCSRLFLINSVRKWREAELIGPRTAGGCSR